MMFWNDTHPMDRWLRLESNPVPYEYEIPITALRYLNPYLGGEGRVSEHHPNRGDKRDTLTHVMHIYTLSYTYTHTIIHIHSRSLPHFCTLCVLGLLQSLYHIH